MADFIEIIVLYDIFLVSGEFWPVYWPILHATPAMAPITPSRLPTSQLGSYGSKTNPGGARRKKAYLVISSRRIMLHVMTDPSDDQLALLGAAFDAFARRYKLADELSSDAPLNELDRQTLLYVSENPACGPSDIARFLGVANTTVSSATDRLVRRGLLQRERPEEDRRAVALSLSKAGTTRVSGLLRAHRDLYRRMLAPLSAREREQFIEMINKIVSYED